MQPSDRLGPYTLLNPLGDDGKTWLARAGTRQVALKIAAAGDAAGRALLLHEVEIAGQFDHPNIARIEEAAEASGITWLALGLRGVPAGTLTLAGFRQLLLALLHVHGNAVVHGDLRPANIFVAEEGELMLANFGYARRIGQAASQEGGRSRYAAPEQLLGDVLDARADLYSAGAMLYQVLTGRMHAVTGDAAPSVVSPGLGTSFDAVAARALAPDKAGRFGSAFEFLLAFDGACQRGVRTAPV